ncbi:MAG: patatin-like phospholipase family protein [Legionellales bacterium]|nr:patatin-like phospholipase family protein [Legionellales bacterium]
MQGIASTTLLEYIERKTGKPISELFDIIAGTSIGALQAVSLTVSNQHDAPRYSAADLMAILSNNFQKDLKVSLWRRVITLNGLLMPLINNQATVEDLREYFGQIQLSQLLSNVLIFGYDIRQHKTLFFYNRMRSSIKENFLVYQLLGGITAIPGVMYPQQVYSLNSEKNFLFCDPTLVINNPIMSALIYANKLYPKNPKILVFVGLGYEKPHATQHKDYGLLASLKDYIAMIFRNHNELLHLYIEELGENQLLGLSKQNIFYLDYKFPVGIGNPLDASQHNINGLRKTALTFIKENNKQLKNLIKSLGST